jgi:type I restriction enzyme, S subunit
VNQHFSVCLVDVVEKLESGSRPKGGASTTSGEIPSLGAEHLDGMGGFLLTAPKLIPQSHYDRMPSGRITFNDILIVKDGATTGKVSFVGATFPFQDAAINEHVFRIAVNAARADPKYVFWYLASPTGQRQVMKDFRGATVGGIGRTFVEKVMLPLPPLEEQRRITALLDRADALRQGRKHAIALFESLTQSIFLEMFGDLNTNPRGWPVKPFGSIVTNCDSRRVPIKQSDRDARPGPYPYYGAVGVIDDIDDFLFEGEHLLVSEDGKHLESRTRPIAGIADGRFWVNNHAHVLSYNGSADLVFLMKFLEYHSISSYVTGIDQIKLNRNSMDAIPVPVPPLDLQLEYRGAHAHLTRQMQKSHTNGGQLDQLFSSLQHRAFSGQL